MLSVQCYLECEKQGSFSFGGTARPCGSETCGSDFSAKAGNFLSLFETSELSKVLEITGNVAAATGLDFRQTAEQIQRAFAGGIAAADVFRERGVRAMLGFEAGAKVSIEQTRKRFFEVFSRHRRR